MLRCDELTERATDYLERQLSVAERLDIYLHLCRCRDCRIYLDQMRTTVRLLRQLPMPPASAEVIGEVVGRSRRSRRGGALRLVIAERPTRARRAAVPDRYT